MTRIRILVGCLVLLLVAAVVATALSWRAERHQAALHDAGTGAVTAAQTAATALTTYDYRTVDRDHERVDRLGTARFRGYFDSVNRKATQAVRALRVTARGRVVAAAPDVRNTEHVVVLLFVDQTVTGRGIKGSHVEQPRVRMSMLRRHGRWLVDEVTLEDSGAAGR